MIQVITKVSVKMNRHDQLRILLLLWYRFSNTNYSTEVSKALAAYRVLRNLIDGNVTDYPGLRRRRTKLTVIQIADIVYKVPVEEYVSPEAINNGECSIARLKRMLVNRGESSVAEACIERDELVKEICKVRNYNEECAICAEEYQEG